MTQGRQGPSTWMIAVGAAAVAIVVAAAVGIGVLSSPMSAPAGAAGTASDGTGALDTTGDPGDVSQEADADDVPGAEEREMGQYVPNEVLVSVADPEALDGLKPGTTIGGATIRSVDVLSDGSDGDAVVKVTFEGDEDATDAIVDELNSMDGVSAQKNFIYRLM